MLSFLLRNVTAKRLLLCGFFLHAGDKIRDTNNLNRVQDLFCSVSKVSPHGGRHIRRMEVGLIQDKKCTSKTHL